METSSRASRHSQRSAAGHESTSSASLGRRRPSHEGGTISGAQGGANPHSAPVSTSSAPPNDEGTSLTEQSPSGRKRKYNTRSSSKGNEDRSPVLKETFAAPKAKDPSRGRKSNPTDETEEPKDSTSPPKRSKKGQQIATSRRSNLGRRKSAPGNAQTGSTDGDTTGSCASNHSSQQRPPGPFFSISWPPEGPFSTGGSTSSTSRQQSSSQQSVRNSSTSSSSRPRMHQQNEPMENESQPTSNVQSNSNNNAMDAQPATAAFGEAQEDGENRLRELLEARGINPGLLGAIAPRMQHFLNTYVVSNSNHSRATQLLETLRSPDENEQLGAVMEMCQTLVMGNEDSLPGFPFKTVIPVLVGLLSGPADGRAPNFEVMHHACRALTYMMDSLPKSTSLIAESIPKFVEKLESIQCMDVAEQSLTALEMLSVKHAKTILHANGVSSCLAFLDFFSMNAQRSALTITANCCAHLGPDDWSLVQPSVSLLAQRLDPVNCENPDKKSIECVCAALSRIVEAFQGNATVLKEVAPTSTLGFIQALLLRSPPLVSSHTFVSVIHMLALLCQGCPSIAVDLLESDIDKTLRQLLIGAEGRKEVPELLTRSPQELHGITGLIMELMPRLPEDGVFAIDRILWRTQSQLNSNNSAMNQVEWSWQDNNMEWQPYSMVDRRCIETAHTSGEEEVTLSINGKSYVLMLTAMQQTSEDTGTTRSIRRTVTNNNAESDRVSQAKARQTRDARIDCVEQKPELISKFVHSLMNILYEIYGSSAGPAVRHKCLRAMLRILYYTDSETLERILKADTVSNHLSQMLSTHNDLRVTVMALQLTEILMQKMPQSFIHSFNREGVIHKILEISTKAVEPLDLPPIVQEAAPSSSSEAAPSAASTEKTAEQGQMFGQRFLGDMLKRKRTSVGGSSSSAAASASGERKRGSELRLKDSGRRVKTQESAKRAGPATRSKISVHGDLESPEESAKPSGSGQSSAQGSSNSSPVTMRYAQGELGLATGASRKATSSASSTSSTSPGGGFFSQLVPSRFCKWGHQNPSSQPAASSSSSTNADRQTVDQQQTKRHRQEMFHKIRQWIHEESHSLNDKYFSVYNHQLCRGILEKLESAVILVKSNSDDPTKLSQGLTIIREVLQQGDVSSFELIHSGMVAAFLDLFADCRSEHFVRNAKILLEVFAGVNPSLSACDSHNGTHLTENSAPYLTLVSRLNSCVSQLEQFPLKVHDVFGGVGNARGASALRFFNTHQLKCNLQRHPSCSNLKQWKTGPVKIDPLALVQAIERYLVVRGFGRLRDEDDGGSEEDNSDEDLDENMMLGTSQSSNRHRLQFLIGETPLHYNMTVYEAIKQYSSTADGVVHAEADLFDMGLGDSSAIWTQTHTIYYKPATNSLDDLGTNGVGQRKKNKSNASKKQSVKDDLWIEGVTPKSMCPIECLLASGKSSEAKLHDPSLQMLSLLRVLYTLSYNWGHLYGIHNFMPVLQDDVFLNAKMSNKSLRQLQDPLALMTGNIPNWVKTLSAFCPFVMPFETRHNLFYSTCFDRDRALQRLMDMSPELNTGDSSDRVAPRIDRKKRTVNRDDLLKQAEIVFNEISANNSRALLEIQYENEVGSGLGPTLEFYALVSRELQRCDLDMWRNSMTGTDRALYQKGGEKKYVFCPDGLYPNPVARGIKSSQLNKIKDRFKMCGKFVAKALMDSRMLDMHFSVPMFKWMLGEEKTLSLRDIQHIDEHLFRNLCKLQSLVEQKNRIIAKNKNLAAPLLAKSLEKLTLDGCSVELLGLDFTLPGYDIELKKGGSNIAVTIHNLDQYIRLVVHWTLIEGVRRQMESFRDGFESIFPIESLRHYFRPFELNRALCGDTAQWSMETLKAACRIDHGFTVESQAILNLFEILEEFDEGQRRQFLLFVTGSPRLPVGGFKALIPTLTIVKKTADDDDGLSPDEYLPSVMTCVNYFKLPDYSTKDIMRKRLLVAQSEGQNSFHLS